MPAAPENPQTGDLFPQEPPASTPAPRTEPPGETLVVRVALDLPMHREFDYLAAEELRDRLAPGARVRVPFGRRKVVGFVVASDVEPAVEFKALRRVIATLDPPNRPALSGPLLEVTRWIASYYAASWGESLRTALPMAAAGASNEARADGSARQRAWPLASWVELEPLGRELELALRTPGRQSSGLPARAPGPAGKRTLERLANAGGRLQVGEAMRLAEATRGHLRALQRRGLVRVDVSDQPHIEEEAEEVEAADREDRVVLTDEQDSALQRIGASLGDGKFEVVLLHGITGSGKTEVYLRAIEQVLDKGLSAIVLVPEIVLTPPLQAKVRERFGSKQVAILHSRQSDGARARAWERVRRGEARVVVGARSAVWAPVPNLGLLVVDEEHEPSYKQEQSPRYHARDVGVLRARQEGAVCVLCSATPSLETLHNARSDKYATAILSKRATGAALPEVELVDLRQEWGEQRGGHSVLSRRLVHLLAQTVERGERAILFLNRRGHATALHCPRCGAVIRCPSCDIALSWHQRDEAALCHYCYHRAGLKEQCPECLGGRLEKLGAGSERLEAEVDKAVPGAGVLRLDTDSLRAGTDVEELLEQFRSGSQQVLVGTQMVAKGLDFEDVTLVGVANADTALSLPDFRAAERTFQLLTQVAGRAGRGKKPGHTVLQTFSPDHYAIVRAASHDYEGFVTEELAHRKALRYPPFSRLVRVVARSPRKETAEEAGQRIADTMRRALQGHDAVVLGPAPCPRAFLNRSWRVHVLVKAQRVTEARIAVSGVQQATATRGFPRAANVAIDVDPVSLL